MKQNAYRRIAVKIGSNVLTRPDGTLDLTRMSALVDQIAELHRAGTDIVLISSGAVAAGRSELHTEKRLDSIAQRQLFSAIGQAKLINRYFELFREYHIPVGQVLTTKESLATRRHYLNQRNCMTALWDSRAIPIVNENDTISVTELMFTDNDELSGMVASMMNAECLVILSNVDGIYNGDPRSSGSEVIAEIQPGDNISSYIGSEKSAFGRGGMLTKYRIASKVADEGIEVIIANGKTPDILEAVLGGLPANGIRCSRFFPSGKPISHVKKWIAHSEGFAKGRININDGAMAALTGDRASSLLPVGVVSVEGIFEKGDIVRIISPDGRQIGVGKASMSSAKASETAGKKGGRPLIHYDYLYIE